MNESIIVSMNGDTVTITTEPSRGGLLLSKKDLLSLLGLFIGRRDVFLRRQRVPQPVVHDWASEMARHFGVSLFDAFEMEASDCQWCGRLVNEPGLCANCADGKAGFLR